MEYKTKMSVLINVADDLDIYGGLGPADEKVQCIDHTTILGRDYYRLKCTVTSSNRDKLVYDKKSGTYSHERFEQDVGESRNGDFGVLFDGTNEKMLFNWYGIINSPSSLMFFWSAVDSIQIVWFSLEERKISRYIVFTICLHVWRVWRWCRSVPSAL